jgi:peptidyl-prolyl cis-trans isomerase SurA
MILIKKPLIAIVLGLCLFGSCKTIDRPGTNKSFISIDGFPVDSNEFIYVFKKNNFDGSTPSIKEIDEYFDLFLNFKLKVAEARSLGYHNTSSFIQEFQMYREELAKPYLTENIVTEKLVQQAYERMKEEVKVSHILISADENTSPEDTLKAFNKINELRQRVLNGEDFNKVAAENSQDPSAKMNSGSLGYFTALQMVYPFEEKAYNTNPGDISPVFRTRFGYHILKVHDRRPSKGKVKVSHIMIRATEGISAEDSVAAQRKIHEIYDNLQQGGVWFDLCQQFSDDLSTKLNGGVLPWFGSGNIAPEFEETAFALNDIGSISKPVQTAYGWHIIKLEDRKGLEPFEEIQGNIRNLVKKDSRSELSKKAFIERLKKENNFVENKGAVSYLLANPEKLLVGEENADKTFPTPDTEIFKINSTPFLVSDLIDYVKRSTTERSFSAQRLELLYNNFVEEQVVEYEKEQLSNKYYEYKMLLTEYEEGILLFQLMDDHIWSKALEDTIGLRDYYNRNIHKYQWGERLDAVVYNASDESIRNMIRPLLEKDFIEIPSAKKAMEFNVGEISLSPANRELLKEVATMVKKNDDWAINLSLQRSSVNQERLDSILNFLWVFMVHKEQVMVTYDEQSARERMDISLITFSRKWLENRFNKESGLNLKVEEGLFERGSHKLIDVTTWQEGLHEINADNRYYLIEVREVVPPGPKKLEDIKGIVISDYQNFLEKEWIEELKEKYPVIINENERKKIYRRLTTI